MFKSAILAAFCAIADAEQELLFKTSMRALETETTNYFAPSYNHDGEEINKSGIVGMCLGFITYGVFLAFALIMIIRDSINRDKMYSQLVEEKKNVLINEYGCTAVDIDRYVEEFEAKNRGKKDAANDEDTKLIN